MKYTIRPFKYGPYDYRDAETLLNKMSQKGWKFKTTSKGWIRNWAMFENAKEENKSTYNIDLKGDMDDREKDEYCRFYADLGWQHLDTYNKKLNIFKSTRENTIPIYSDDQAEYENLREYAKPSTDIPYIMQFIGMAILSYVIYKLVGIGLSLVLYSMMVVLSVFVIDAAVMIFLDMVYRSNCKKSMEKTGQLPENVLFKKWRVWEVYGENLLILFIGFGTIFGYGYEIWGKGLISHHEMYLEVSIYFSLAFVGFWGTLLIDYIYMMKPEKKILKGMDFIFHFLWLFSFMSYLQFLN